MPPKRGDAAESAAPKRHHACAKCGRGFARPGACAAHVQRCSVAPPSPPPRPPFFPHQDGAHLSPEFKAGVVDAAVRSGMCAAVRMLLPRTSFDASQPHNLNLWLVDGGRRALVWRRVFVDGVLCGEWSSRCDVSAAVVEVIEDAADVVRNLADDLTPNSDARSAAVEAAYANAPEYTQDAGLAAHVVAMGCALSERLRHLAVAISASAAASASSAAASEPA
jgi:hypothetical protein